jgi:hypothetical protein
MPPDDCVSTSISLSLSSPARSFLRKESRVAGLEAGPTSASILGGELGARLHVLALALAHLCDPDLDEIADDLLDVAADIADLGEFGGLDLDEGRGGELCQPPRDLGLADAGRTDHQDIFRQHFFAQAAGELQPSPAVAQRDGHRALGIGLADDETVEFGNDFAGREVCHGL